jgi:nucleoside-diphosphate-sugar epimerase
MADNGSILVTGAAGQLGAVGRTVTGLLLDRGLPVRPMVRREDDRAAALRAAGAEVDGVERVTGRPAMSVRGFVSVLCRILLALPDKGR